MPYYRITIELKGATPSGIRWHDSKETDIVYSVFRAYAWEHYKEKMLHFRCEQLSNRSEEVKLIIKQQGKTGKTTYEKEPDMLFSMEPPPANQVWKKEFRKGPGKYKSPKSDTPERDWGKEKRKELGMED